MTTENIERELSSGREVFDERLGRDVSGEDAVVTPRGADQLVVAA